MAPSTRGVKRTPSAIATRASSSKIAVGKRALRRKHSPGRTSAKPLHSFRRQPSVRQQPPRRASGPRRQPSSRQGAPVIRQPFAPNVQAPVFPPPVQVQRPAVRLESLERPISPPQLNRVTAKRKRPARRAPIIRPGSELAWDAPDGPPPLSPEEVARRIFRERDMPALIDAAPQVERRLLLNAFEEGRLPHEFSATQLMYASVIARSCPQHMDMSHFIARLLQRTRNQGVVVTGKQLCFDSLDYVKDMMREGQEKNLVLAAKYEKERIARKRAERALRQATRAAQVQDLPEDATQLLADHQREVDGQHGIANEYPDIAEANVVAAQPERQSIPVVCYLLLRHSRALHALLSDQTISPNRLSACILETIQLISQVIECTTSHSPTHYSRADLRQTFKIASSVFGICLRGLQHLCRDIPGRQLKGQVIYHLCAVFKAGLKHNEELCMSVAKEAYEIARGDLPLAQRRVLSSLELHEVDIPYLLSCRTEFLASIFLSKEDATMPRPTCYTTVLEGLSAELYNKVGTLVSETVFKERVTESHLLGHISLIPPGQRPDEVRELAVAIERDQVLKLFRIVVRRLSSTTGEDGAQHSPAHYLAQLISTEKLLTGSERNHGRLFRIAKEKLQHTLCKAVFGEDNGEFKSALMEMDWEDESGEAEHGDRDGREVVVNDKGEKFVEGIWEMVGWDILEEI